MFLLKYTNKWYTLYDISYKLLNINIMNFAREILILGHV